MNGQHLFEKYQQYRYANEGSAEREYARTLSTALFVVGSQRLYSMLEEAEQTGQQISLTYPIPVEDGPSEPDGIRLVRAMVLA